jgi:flagella basal body P-ring formation protein FlgA
MMKLHGLEKRYSPILWGLALIGMIVGLLAGTSQAGESNAARSEKSAIAYSHGGLIRGAVTPPVRRPVVKTTAQAVPVISLRESAEMELIAAIEARIPYKDAQVEIVRSNFYGASEKKRVNTADLSVELQPNEDFRGPIRARLVLPSRTSREGDIWIMAEARIILPVAVVTRPVRRDEILSEENIAIELLDLNGVRGTFFQDMTAIIGKVATQNINPGMVIANHSIAKPVLIQKGELLPAMVSTGRFRIEVRVMAKQKGREGELIEAVNVSSGKVIQGRVTADGKLDVFL